MSRGSRARAGIYRSAAGAAEVERHYRDLLDRWPAPAEHHRLPTCQGETFVVASGPPDGPPVLALHGSGANSAMWSPWIAELARHLRVYTVDVIGEPGRSAPVRLPLASDGHARWLDDVLAGLALPKTSIIGVSLGGWLAVDYAIRRPERVSRLALLAPSGFGRQKVGVLIRFALLRPFGDRGLRAVLRSVGATETRSPLGEHTLLVFKHFRPRMAAIPRFDTESLRRLDLPVLAVLGGRDTLLDSAGTARRLAETVPHATVRLLPEAGHILPDQIGPVADFLLEREREPHA